MPVPPEVERLRERPASAMESLPDAAEGLETGRSLAEVIVIRQLMLVYIASSFKKLFSITKFKRFIRKEEIYTTCIYL